MKGSPGEQDESLLDNWIKELESGIKGMADLTGAPAEVIDTHTHTCSVNKVHVWAE